MIDPSQTAFVPCRSLMDNILLSQELLRNYHRESPCPRCAIKVDFQKAYDSNNWNFILDTLHCFNFPSNVIQWIRTCITTPSFSIPNISTLVSIKLTETNYLLWKGQIQPFLIGKNLWPLDSLQRLRPLSYKEGEVRSSIRVARSSIGLSLFIL